MTELTERELIQRFLSILLVTSLLHRDLSAARVLSLVRVIKVRGGVQFGDAEGFV